MQNGEVLSIEMGEQRATELDPNTGRLVVHVQNEEKRCLRSRLCRLQLLRAS